MTTAIEQTRQLAAPDMARVDRVIQDKLQSDVVLINQLSKYIIGAGGKRFRPLVLMLAARSLTNGQPPTGDDWAPQLAAVVEFIHTATLLHDDVVDESTLRRGRETANELFGNAASVLTGDFLYSRAFEMMVEVGKPKIMAVLAHATNRIAEGEVLQLMNIGDADLDEQRYMDVIARKTATLFEAACQLAAIVNDAPDEIEQALGAYGLHLGTAFQLIDDVLDYNGDEGETGKHVGDDLAEGKPTLPLIVAMERSLASGDQASADTIRQAIEQHDDSHLHEIVKAVEQTGALAYTARLAENEAEQAKLALTPIPDGPHKQALFALADAAVQRNG